MFKAVPDYRCRCRFPAYLFLLCGIMVCANCGTFSRSRDLSSDLETTRSPNINSNQPSQYQISDEKVVFYNGVSFYYDSILADEVLAEVIEDYRPEDPTFRPDGFEPRHITFRFKGAYSRNHDQSSEKPEISIYSINEYKRIVRRSGDYAKVVEGKFQYLQTILLERPSEINGEYPFINFVDAIQVIHSHKSYISFGNGSGIAYLTQFNHADPDLITNNKLVYVFQGITDNGKYFISAVFPVRAPFLPNDRNITSYKNYTLPPRFFEPNARAENERGYNLYLSDVRDELENTHDEDFMPSLVSLRKLLISLDVKPSIFSGVENHRKK